MLLEPPSAEQLASIYQELGLTDRGIHRDVEHLQEWISKQSHLPKTIDARWLRNSLIFRKNSLEKVKESVELFYTAKSHVPELLANRDPQDPQLQGAISNFFCYPLARLTREGSRIIFFKLMDPDVRLFHYATAAKVLLMSATINLLEDQCRNHIIVFDMKGIHMGHLGRVPVPLVAKFLHIAQRAYPIRQKAVHVIFAPPYIETMLNIFKPFLKKKLVDRIHLHVGGVGNMFDSVPRPLFPSDYGGDQPSLVELHAQWKQKLESYRDWFLADDLLVVDERRRPGKPTTHSDIFGFEGSFRQLNVD